MIDMNVNARWALGIGAGCLLVSTVINSSLGSIPGGYAFLAGTGSICMLCIAVMGTK